MESPKGLIYFFSSLNNAFLELFSLPLFVKTFFKPWKNEYRKGLVGFSIGMGMFLKSIVITVDIILLFILLALETIVLFLFFAWPLSLVVLFFLK
ncbi:MAG: hypothetical protein Q8P26_00095 [Candidatus Levybacteria bacterium]|nr:hypothetical protein [Candidatus Levybacteria bacterium]